MNTYEVLSLLILGGTFHNTNVNPFDNMMPGGGAQIPPTEHTL